MSRSLSVALLGLVGLLANPARADDPPARGLDIYFIDVMGGAATLIVTPEGESVLIDSGWPAQEGRDAKRIEHVVKEVAKLDRIDHLVTTHWHVDHYGGVENLAARLPIGRYWDRGLPEEAVDGAKFPDGPRIDDPLGIAYRRLTEGRRTALKAGDRLPLKGATEAVVIASGGRVIAAPAGTPPNPRCESGPAEYPPDPSDNALSLALRFRLGKFDFFDGGDLTRNGERSLVCPVDRVGPIDVYQVTHHGLDTSNEPTLIATIAPTVAIMNNGPRKGGSAATVALLKAQPTIEAAYQLHKNQATGPDENTSADLIANADPAGGRYVHVAVRPDGSRYSVRIGPDGEPREFAAK